MELYNKKVLFLLSLTPVLANAENVSSSVKKNVIFIAVDDLRPELNCYGANHMFTRILMKWLNRVLFLIAHIVIYLFPVRQEQV